MTKRPAARTVVTSFSISFRVSGKHAKVTCKLDRRHAARCKSPFRGKAGVGSHKVTIVARNAAGASGRRVVRWRVGSAPKTHGVAFFQRYASDWNPTITKPAADVAHYRFIILEGSSLRQRKALRAHGGSTRLLVYKNALATVAFPRTYPLSQDASGVSYHEATTKHPDWFLLNRSGQRISRHYTASETDYMMDIGNTGYQNQVAANIIKQARQDGWDGVFLDDVLPSARYWLASGSPADVARYPTDAAFSAAFTSFIKNVGTKVRAAGLIAIANTAGPMRTTWARYLDGTMDESFVNPSNGWSSALSYESVAGSWNDWRMSLKEVVTAERTGKFLLANTRGTTGNPGRGRYALATVLLAANGKTSFEYHTSGGAETWNADEQTATRLGAPSGTYRRLSSGVYKRSFANGVVLVNPKAPGTAAITVRVGGSFSGSGLSHVSSVTMTSESGLVLIRDP